MTIKEGIKLAEAILRAAGQAVPPRSAAKQRKATARRHSHFVILVNLIRQMDGLPPSLNEQNPAWISARRFLLSRNSPLPKVPQKTKALLAPEGVDVSSKAFLETLVWRRLRYQALIKYGRRCQCCGATPATGAIMNVDHIKPRRHFPELALDISNLQILCQECNQGKGNWNETDWREAQAITSKGRLN